VEIACGEEGEKELWMPAVVTEVVLVEKLKGVNPEPAMETLGQDDGKFLARLFHLCFFQVCLNSIFADASGASLSVEAYLVKMLGSEDVFELEMHSIRAVPERVDIPVTVANAVIGKEYQCW
jgi:hypothetical protein